MPERKRRQYGSGSVYQRSSDGRWLGVVQAGWNASGGRRTITVSAADEAECKRRLRDKQRAIARDGLPDTGASTRVTVRAWAEVWLAAQATRLRPSAYTTSRAAVTAWIVPTIGHKQLAALTPGDIRAVTAAMRKAGRKSSSALRAHSVLTSMLRAALIEGHPVPPRVLLVERPSINVSDREALPSAEAAALLAAAAELPHASRWVAALLQGIRQGECLGLTWDAVDRRAGHLDIAWQLQPLPYVDRKDKSKGFRVPDNFEARHLEGRYHLTRPKTARGQRIIPVVPWFATALERWREIAPESPHGLVWPALDGGPASVKHDLDEWKGLQGAVGIGHQSGRAYLLHEARHTTASLLVELGVDRATIEAILGQVRLVESYVHVQTHMAATALEQVAQRLELGDVGTTA